MRRWRIYTAESVLTGQPVDAITYPSAIARLPLGVPTEIRVSIVDGVQYPEGITVRVTRVAECVRDPQDGSWLWSDPSTGAPLDIPAGGV